MARIFSTTIALVLLVSIFVSIPVSAEKSYYAEAFDVQIEIQKGGSAIITETIEFQFSGTPFMFVSREISSKNTDGITFLDASIDGIQMPQGTQAGQVEVNPGDPLEVTWHFMPISDSSHIFTVRYRAEGVIRKGSADTLVWRLIPDDHNYSIVHSTITLAYPSEPPLIERPALNIGSDVIWEDGRIIFTASSFKKDEDLILIARFAPNSVTKAAPGWQMREAAASRTLSMGFAAGLAILVIGGLGLFMYFRTNNQRKGDRGAEPSYEK